LSSASGLHPAKPPPPCICFLRRRHECNTRRTLHRVFLGLHRVPWHSTSSGFPVVVGYFPTTNPCDHMLHTQSTSSQRSSLLGWPTALLVVLGGACALAWSRMSYLSTQGQIRYLSFNV
jgi:hypothetical protein